MQAVWEVTPGNTWSMGNKGRETAKVSIRRFPLWGHLEFISLGNFR